MERKTLGRFLTILIVALTFMPNLVTSKKLNARVDKKQSLLKGTNNKCDDLASSPHDKFAQAVPVSYIKLRQTAQDAVKFCKLAVEKFPEIERTKYQLGRSLVALGKNIEAARWLRQAADDGYPVALNAYGVLLNHGRGVETDNIAAFKYIKEAADKGNVPAMANLGAMYSNVTGSSNAAANNGAIVEREKSLKWLNAAANAGDPLAMARLAWNYGMGDGGAIPDKKLAFQWVDRALQQNEESAYYIAIEIARSGFADIKLTKKYEKLAGRSKNRLALSSILGSYSAVDIKRLSEIGFRFDRAEEEPVYIREFIFDQDGFHATMLNATMDSLTSAARRAAKAFIVATETKRKQRMAKKASIQEKPAVNLLPKVGAETECDLLATSPHDNLALPPSVSYTKIRMQAEKAVAQCRVDVAKFPENARQKYQLGRALIALGKNEEAANFLLQAAKSEYPVAMNAYGVLLNHGRGVAIDYKSSFSWLLRAAKKNNLPAAINLATAYFMGLGTPLDAEGGTFWTKISAAGGDPKAMFTLGAAKLQEGLWYRTILVRRKVSEGWRLLIQAHRAGESEATFILYRASIGYTINRFKVRGLADIIEPVENYKNSMEMSGDRRWILNKLLNGKRTPEKIISAIKNIRKLPHPVDQPEREPVYVVDSYMDNEWVLGQILHGVANKLIGVDKELTKAYRALVDAPRSFERASP